MFLSELKSCPRCGDEEFYTKNFLRGPSWYYLRFDGEESDNGSMYDRLNCKYGKIAYCAGCDMKMGNLLDDTLSKQAEKELKRRSKDEV